MAFWNRNKNPKKSSAFSDAWNRANELFAAGDPEFVDAIRAIPDPDELGKFAQKWYTDPRPVARKLLHDYLARPLNALRHEPLVKRLFKLAEAANDDATMARFLVLFDRSVRRRIRTRKRYRYENTRGWGREVVTIEEEVLSYQFQQVPREEWIVERITNRTKYPWFQFDLGMLRLFSGKTRNYLRRRAWRYFRKLGRQHPERYIATIPQTLTYYTDADTADGLELLDNWGLMHILFHHCPVVEAKPTGWVVASGQSLAALAPAPMFNDLWKAKPELVLGLLDTAKCRPVRRWAMKWLAKESPATLDALPLNKLLSWVESRAPDLAEFALTCLRQRSNLGEVSVELWLHLIEKASPDVLDLLCELIGKHVTSDRLSLMEAVRLAKLRPSPIARLALGWLESKRPQTPAEIDAVLSLREAEAEPIRPALAKWAAGVLSAVPSFQTSWVVDFLDSRHDDVRHVGSEWLEAEPRARDDHTVWQKLLESPYDDVRLRMVLRLEELATAKPDGEAVYRPELVRLLWATVLLNIHRGGRSKPVVVRQLVNRLTRHPSDATHLMPVLAVAVRSIRGPEFRSGLTAVVQLLGTQPGLAEPIATAFPELKLEALV